MGLHYPQRPRSHLLVLAAAHNLAHPLAYSHRAQFAWQVELELGLGLGLGLELEAVQGQLLASVCSQTASPSQRNHW